jgi:hemoglobin
MSRASELRPRGDIGTRADIEALVSRFYVRAFADPFIGPVFTEVARVDLAAHVPIVSDFWESALLRRGTYRRNAFLVHQNVHDAHPLTPPHFARWLDIWTATVDDLHAGPVAERAKAQGARIAASMARRLNARSGVFGDQA